MTDTHTDTETASDTAILSAGDNASDSADSRTLIRATLVDVLPHPANPRAEVGDLSDLIPSVAEGGVRQPPTVLPADRVAAAWRHAAEAATTTEARAEAEGYAEAIEVSGAPYVLVMGHRRRAAAHLVAAGATADTYPEQLPSDAAMDAAATTAITVMLETGDLADDALDQHAVMLDENIAREDLPILDLARAFAVRKASGQSERTIAKRFSCSQSLVNKRLALLKLPEEIQAAAGAGEIKLADAVELSKVTDVDVQAAAWTQMKECAGDWRSRPEVAIRDAQQQVDRDRSVTAARSAAEAEGLEFVPDAYEKWDYAEARQRRLDDDDAITAAREAGDLVASVNISGQPTYYTSADLADADNDTVDYAQQERDDQRERRVAMKAREAAAVAIVAEAPDMPETPAAREILEVWLDRPGSDLATIAKKWLAELGIGPAPRPGREWLWTRDVLACDWATIAHVAWAVAVARHEVDTRATYRTWGQEQIDWLDRLIADANYQPTAWEQDRLEQARRDVATKASATARSTVATSVLQYSDIDNAWLLLVGDDEEPVTCPEPIPADNDPAACGWAETVFTERGLPRPASWTAADDGAHTPELDHD